MASIVPCVHSLGGTYPDSTPLSSTLDVIKVSLVEQEFHRLVCHTKDYDGIHETATSYQASKATESDLFNPFCEECEESLIEHLMKDYPLQHYSADRVVQTLRELVHEKHVELQDTNYMYPDMMRFEDVESRMNFYFDKTLLKEDGHEFYGRVYGDEVGGLTPSCWKVSETLVKATLDGDWAVYLPV